MVGTGIVAANHFNFSWQNLVEKTVLGENIANQTLTEINLTTDALVNFGNATLVFNWNQLHHWDGTNKAACSKWFLKEKTGRRVQYPVYTSALFQASNDGDGNRVEVNMQGKPMDG